MKIHGRVEGVQIVELVSCPNRISKTGQDCTDKTCRTCNGTGKFWRENRSAAVAFKRRISLGLMSKMSVGALLANILDDVISSHLFDHGCGNSVYPCSICDTLKARELFAYLVDARAAQLLEQRSLNFKELD